MSGYVRPSVKATFDESNGDMAGFVFRFRRPSIDDLVTLSGIDGLSEGAFTDDDRATMDSVFRVLASRIISWNLMDAASPGTTPTPVPITPETVAEQDIDFVMELIRAMTRGAEVPAPLPEPSNAGQRWVEEASIPMEPLYANLPS